MTIKPLDGDLIIFPGWVRYQIPPAKKGSSIDEISISFNIAGDWSVTTSVSDWFEL